MSMMNDIIEELKTKILTVLDLPDVTPDDITPDSELVGGDLGLDSIDILEIVMMLEKDYGVRIDNRELGAKVLVSLKTLAAYVETQQADQSP
jgi:acyl carrier protein